LALVEKTGSHIVFQFHTCQLGKLRNKTPVYTHFFMFQIPFEDILAWTILGLPKTVQKYDYNL